MWSVREKIEYICFKIGIKILIFLPEFLDKIILKFLSFITKTILYSRHRMMLKNLFLSLKDSSFNSREKILKIANNVWYFTGKTFLKSLRYINKPWNIKKKIFLTQNINISNSGTIIFSAHIGNWELLAQRLVIKGYKVAAIVRKLRNSLVDREVKRLRESLGGKVFYSDEINEIINWIKSGNIVYILPDQHIVEGSVRINFLGRKAFTTTIIPLLSKRLNCRVYGMFCIRENNKYRIYVEEFIPEVVKDFKSYLEINTLKINQIIEKYILNYPEQWFWLHNRWKDK